MNDNTSNFEIVLNELLGRVSTGKAILFTGAGFSTGMKNIKGEEPPKAADLAYLICKLGKFEEDNDLKYVADYYIQNCDHHNLIDLLKTYFTLIETTESQTIISSFRWKRIYTTNYDNSVEFSAQKAGKIIECVTLNLNKDLKKIYQSENICVHINGSISTLDEDALESDFKLSNSSYINPGSFVDSSWYYQFKKDLASSSAIVFVGYSLYDIDIQKILFGCNEYKAKTFFVVRKNPSNKEIFNLCNFGTVLSIGIDEFANRLSSINKFEDIKSSIIFDAFAKYSLCDEFKEIRDKDIEAFLLNGSLDSCHIDNAISSSQNPPYLVIRDELQKAVEILNSKSNIVIVGDFGNGKTVFVKELMSYLTLSGAQVFELFDDEASCLSDLDEFIRLDSEVILVLDGYEKYFDLIEYFGRLNPMKIRLILTSRTSNHERNRKRLQEVSIIFKEIYIDFLTSIERSSLVEIIDNLGYWGDMARYSSLRKEEIVKKDYGSQFSLVLLRLFDAPQIKNRIQEIVENLFLKEGFKSTIFVICLLEVLDLPLSYSFISEVSNSDVIYSSELHSNELFLQLFPLYNGKVRSKSPILSISLLRGDFFSPSFIVSKLLEIVEKYNSLPQNSREEKELFKSLLRFSTIENILPSTKKKNSLVNYYEKLKNCVPWLREDPHYWLQYGMARITFKEFDIAERYFDTAYSLAGKKGNYDTSYIDVQQARIFLYRALQEMDPAKSFRYFDDGHKLLIKVENDIYKFRQVNSAYKNIFDEKYSNYSPKHKVEFEHACKRMKSDLEGAENSSRVDRNAQKIFVTKQELTTILDAIVQSRVEET